MAQPVFDGHPLEQYFQDSGETSELMPGGIPDASLQPYLTDLSSISKHSEKMEKICFLIFNMLESLSSFFSPDHMSLRTKAFAERFKYGVISSSLLSPALAATPSVESHRRGFSPPLPGLLSNSHSRTTSAAESTSVETLSLSMPTESETPIWPITLSFTVAVAALSARFYFFTFLLLSATLYYIHVHRLDVCSRPDVMTPKTFKSLLALQQLISAGQFWDSVINDTFSMLENEEQSVFHLPASPLMPSSSLRVALSTSLLTTQTQCDNVRQLLSAITSPSELAQLAEMYAPPSPIKPTFASSNDSHRPLSHPGPPPRTPLSDRARKRSTWNGSYTSLALAGTPPAFQHTQRREKRRSDLSALLGTTSPTPARIRPPTAPSSPLQLLADVSEKEEDGMATAESSLADEEEHSFGAAALHLYRKRANGGLQALELSPRGVTPARDSGDDSTSMKTRRRTSTISPGSKYTSMQHTTRHPFSLSSLRQSLQNALASKRFACSHLLALRFEDDEDEVYWEDVRSVMGLLTSTLVDASSRLSEVLDEVEERQLKADDSDADGAFSESRSRFDPHTPPNHLLPSLPIARTHTHSTLSRAIEHMQIVSFAPTPSHLARFTSHVNAISTALDDAREQLAHCVASLKEERTIAADSSPGHSTHPSTSSAGDAGVPLSDAHAALGASTPHHTSGARSSTSSSFSEPHPALQAYECLRRELGVALRECERGRERLVFLVSPPTPLTEEETSLIEVQHDPEDSAQPDGEEEGGDDDVHLTLVSPLGEAVPLDHADAGLGLSVDEDEQALLAPPGVEQVFEAESTVGAFTREKSTLSREERIRRVKAKRARDSGADGASASASIGPPRVERWGPSGEVVQELRDVIWQVGERRRKRMMTATTTTAAAVNVENQLHALNLAETVASSC